MSEAHKFLEDNPLFKKFYEKAREESLGANNYFLKGKKDEIKALCSHCYNQNGSRYNSDVVQGNFIREKRTARNEKDKRFVQFLKDSCDTCFENNFPTPLVSLLLKNLL